MRNKFFAALVSFIILLSPLQTLAYNQNSAASYIKSKPSNPWSTMALAALNESNIPTDHLTNITGTSAVEYEAPILAITSLGKNPRTFGSTDYVAKLKSFYNNGQIGDQTTLNDDYFGLLALASAGESNSDTVISNTKSFVLAKQNSDGGFGFTTSSTSDTNMTAVAIMSLIATGSDTNNEKIQKAFTYLKNSQNSDGGFGYEPGSSSDSSSTAWVMWALTSLNTNPNTLIKEGKTPNSYLENNQADNGYFKYQGNSNEDAFSAVTTSYAVIGLANKTLPIKIVSAETPTTKYSFRIEGKNETVCEGSVSATTALDVIKNAKNLCGYTYTIQETSFGPYLKKLNSDEASGLVGWLYLVNSNSPDVGAADYQLKPGDSVLWFFGDFNWKPSRLTLSNSKIDSGTETQVTVEGYQNGNWTALSGASVYFGANNVTTDNSGHANLKPKDGYYKVSAAKDGFIRSNQILLQVGNPTSGNVSLNVTVEQGQVGGANDTIAFTVNPNNIDFGTLKQGQSSTKQLVIKNTGGKDIGVEAVMTGDSLFTDNTQIENTSWKNFKTDLLKETSKNANATLTIPSSYNGGSGSKNAVLTFWATGK